MNEQRSEDQLVDEWISLYSKYVRAIGFMEVDQAERTSLRAFASWVIRNADNLSFDHE